MIEPKRTITAKEKEEVLSLKYEDVSKTLIQNWFAKRYDPVTGKVIPSKFHAYDEFQLKKGESFNKEDITTTVGIYLVNIFLFERFKDILGYVNETLSAKKEGAVNSKIDAALLEDRITTEQYIHYLDDSTWLKFIAVTELTTSLTTKSLTELPAVKKRKAELVKQHKDKLDAGDVPTGLQIEEELLAIAKKDLEDDPCMEMYDSGARGNFGSAYKSAQVMNGAVYNSTRGKYDIMTNSLANGISKRDMATLANSAVDSQFSKSVGPGECGYLTKKINAMFQSEVLDKPGSDCGTKQYKVVKLTKDNASLYHYCYMIEGSKLVQLTPEVESKYIGKTVKMRSVQFCKGKKRCNKCMGDMLYKLNFEKVGLAVSVVSGTLLNKKMKVFHDPRVKIYNITEEDFE